MTLEIKQPLLYLATFDPTVRATGTATRGRLFLSALVEQFSVHLVHMREADDEGKDLELIDRLASITSLPHRALAYFLFSPAFLRAGQEAMRRHGCRLIFADFEKAGWYAHLISRWTKVDYVYNSHNVEFRRYLSFAKRDPRRYPFVPLMYYLERTACRHAALTVSISSADAATFLRWIPEDQMMVLPCAFDEKMFHPFYADERSERPRILMVGNYRNAGNREGAYFLRQSILPSVLQRHPDAVFRCIGNHFPPDLHHPNLQAPGFVEDLVQEYRNATVVVAPITMGGGIKIKVVEALACGKFLVATEKAMEGINYGRLANVDIVALESFPEAVLRAIAARPIRTMENWQAIQQGFGARFGLEKLKARMGRLSANEDG